MLFHSCGETRTKIATAVIDKNVTKVVGKNDVVEALTVDAGVFDRLLCGQKAEIRGDLIVLGKSPLADLCDLLKLADSLFIVSRVDRLVVIHEKSIVQELVIAHPLVGDETAGSDDHCPPHRSSSFSRVQDH